MFLTSPYKIISFSKRKNELKSNKNTTSRIFDAK